MIATVFSKVRDPTCISLWQNFFLDVIRHTFSYKTDGIATNI